MQKWWVISLYQVPTPHVQLSLHNTIFVYKKECLGKQLYCTSIAVQCCGWEFHSCSTEIPDTPEPCKFMYKLLTDVFKSNRMDCYSWRIIQELAAILLKFGCFFPERSWVRITTGGLQHAMRWWLVVLLWRLLYYGSLQESPKLHKKFPSSIRYINHEKSDVPLQCVIRTWHDIGMTQNHWITKMDLPSLTI